MNTENIPDAMIRHLTFDDILAAFDLSYAAGWNQTAEDWRRLLTLEPDGCFGVDCDGRLVATTTLLCHERELAWVGMVLTHPNYQRRGFAQRLVEAALAFADRRGIRSVKLDATDQGRPVYLRLGFEDEQSIERWKREPGSLVSLSNGFAIGEPNRLLDRDAFGADRGRFLAALGKAWLRDDAFVMQRSGSRARYLGPCVARDPAEALPLIRGMVSSQAEELWFWDLLPKQTEAVKIARDLGFSPARRLIRMRRGALITTNDDLVYAIGGFEAG